MNLYAYAGNNPISFSDPYGLCPEIVTGTPCPGWLATGVGFVPIAGDAIDIAGALLGQDLLTGEDISGMGIAATVVGTILGSGRAGRQVANAAETAFERGVRNPAVRAAIERGMEAHRVFYSRMQAQGWTTNRSGSLWGGLRPDAWRVDGKTVYVRELKPNTDSGRRAMAESLDRYNKRLRRTCPDCTVILQAEFYEP